MSWPPFEDFHPIAAAVKNDGNTLAYDVRSGGYHVPTTHIVFSDK